MQIIDPTLASIKKHKPSVTLKTHSVQNFPAGNLVFEVSPPAHRYKQINQIPNNRQSMRARKLFIVSPLQGKSVITRVQCALFPYNYITAFS